MTALHPVAAPPVGRPTPEVAAAPPAPVERSTGSLAARLNWLRAGVLGANDGIVSTAALVLGVAGATTSRSAIVLAGLVGLLAGASSMAVGEYVSVSTQRDTWRSARARRAPSVRDHGADAELDELSNPWPAALASFTAFVVGAAVPLLGVLVSRQVVVTVIAVAVALVATGALSARLGAAPVGRAVLRNMVGGLAAMGLTYGLGTAAGLLLH